MDTNALFNIGYGLYLLSAHEDEKDNACIINSVMQVTSTPCQIAVTVNKNNYTTTMIQRTRKLNLSILSEDTSFDVIKNFGYQSGKHVDKFTNFFDTKRSYNGLLYLTKYTNSYLSAYVQQEIDLGSHIMFIAQIVGAEILNNTKTLTYDYYQNNIKPSIQTVISKGWRCKICNFVYESDNLPEDYMCPICKHTAVDFELI